MEKEKIVISIDDKSLVGIAGREFGKKVYNECVGNKIDLSKNQKYSLVFPDQIQMISRSFILGFTNELCKVQGIGVNQFYDYFEIDSKNQDAKLEFEEGLGIKNA